MGWPTKYIRRTGGPGPAYRVPESRNDLPALPAKPRLSAGRVVIGDELVLLKPRSTALLSLHGNMQSTLCATFF